MSELQRVLIDLARARNASAKLKASRDEARKVHRMTVEYNVWVGLGQLYTDTRAVVSAAEIEARSRAVDAFDGENRFPAEGVEIKQFAVVERVKHFAALQEWAWKHLPSAFVLDMKKFDAAVKAGLVPADVARMTKEPRASIKRDLDFLLEKKDDE